MQKVWKLLFNNAIAWRSQTGQIEQIRWDSTRRKQPRNNARNAFQSEKQHWSWKCNPSRENQITINSGVGSSKLNREP